jgi:hypothetical protein
MMGEESNNCTDKNIRHPSFHSIRLLGCSSVPKSHFTKCKRWGKSVMVLFVKSEALLKMLICDKVDPRLDHQKHGIRDSHLKMRKKQTLQLVQHTIIKII